LMVANLEDLLNSRTVHGARERRARLLNSRGCLTRRHHVDAVCIKRGKAVLDS
jgi:hypothetical protein